MRKKNQIRIRIQLMRIQMKILKVIKT